MKCIVPALLCTAALCSAADVPSEPLAKKGAHLFSDDFERAELGEAWRAPAPAWSIVDGAMKGSQTRADQGAVGAVHLAFKDAVIEFKFRLEGAASINAVCDDKAWTASHAGHICRTTITPKLIWLGDDKEGGMLADVRPAGPVSPTN